MAQEIYQIVFYKLISLLIFNCFVLCSSPIMPCLSSLCIFLVIVPATVNPQQETRELGLIGDLPEEVLSLTKEAEVCTSVQRNGVIPTDGQCPERSISTDSERKLNQLKFHGKIRKYRRVRRSRQNNNRVRCMRISGATERNVRQSLTKRSSFSAVRVASRRSQRSKAIESRTGRKLRRLHRVQRFEGKLRKFARFRREKHFTYRVLGSTRITGREQPRRVMRRKKNRGMERVMRHARNNKRLTVNRKGVWHFARRTRNRIGRLSNRRRNNIKERFAGGKGRIHMERMRSSHRGRRVVRRERNNRGRIVHLEKSSVGRTLRRHRNNIRHRTRRTRNKMGKNNRHSSYYRNNRGKENALSVFEQVKGGCREQMIKGKSKINLTNDFNHSSHKRSSTIGRTRLGTRFRSRNRCPRFHRVTDHPDHASEIMRKKAFRATFDHPRRQFPALPFYQENEINIGKEIRETLQLDWQKSSSRQKHVNNHTPTLENPQNDVTTRHERETNRVTVPIYIMDGIQLLPGDAAGETYSGEVINQ